MPADRNVVHNTLTLKIQMEKMNWENKQEASHSDVTFDWIL